MRVLIIGASGLVGNGLLQTFRAEDRFETKGTYFTFPSGDLSALDLRNTREVEDLFNGFKPGIVLLPAFSANVDHCEENPEETRRTNVDGALNIIARVKRTGLKLVYFSSDYIFDGQKGPYKENDPPNPINEYGRQKLEVERAIQGTLDDHLIIRTTVVYGWEKRGKNFVMNLINRLNKKEKVKVPFDQIGTPTYVDDLARAVTTLVKLDKKGVFNVAGRDLLGRLEFAKIAADVFGLDVNLIMPVSTEELHQKAKRPLNAGMIIDKCERETGIRLLGAREGLEAMKRGMS